MKRVAMSLVFCCIFLVAKGQENIVEKYAGTITLEDLKDYISILASDALEGRETGTRGQKMAAAFIESHFTEIGLQPGVNNVSPPGYYQDVPLEISQPGETYLVVNGTRKENFQDIIYYGIEQIPEESALKVVFGGEGQDEVIESMDLKGKGLLIYNKSGFQAYSAIRKKAQEKGAKALLIVNTDSLGAFNKLAKQFKSYIGRGSLKLPSKDKNNDNIGVFLIPPELAIAILDSGKKHIKKSLAALKAGDRKAIGKIKEGEVRYKITRDVQTIISENVLGYVEGHENKDELIVITAHYDHIGRNGDEINNGADDDASGTAAVMEIAEAFAKAKQNGHGPRRSILFMAVTGEEKGLLGSQYYVENPVYSLENTMVNLNIDMIGRIDDKHKDHHDYVYLVGSDKLSRELHDISENVNNKYMGLKLDYTYNDENHPERIYYRSDHWNFAKNNIPVIFYYNGSHPDYHRPTDTIDKIAFETLQKRTKLIFYTAWELANRENKIALNQ